MFEKDNSLRFVLVALNTQNHRVMKLNQAFTLTHGCVCLPATAEKEQSDFGRRREKEGKKGRGKKEYACMRTHIYMQCLHTYIHTYVHTYICICALQKSVLLTHQQLAALAARRPPALRLPGEFIYRRQTARQRQSFLRGGIDPRKPFTVG